jgi:hypothetical protein
LQIDDSPTLVLVSISIANDKIAIGESIVTVTANWTQYNRCNASLGDSPLSLPAASIRAKGFGSVLRTAAGYLLGLLGLPRSSACRLSRTATGLRACPSLIPRSRCQLQPWHLTDPAARGLGRYHLSGGQDHPPEHLERKFQRTRSKQSRLVRQGRLKHRSLAARTRLERGLQSNNVCITRSGDL